MPNRRSHPSHRHRGVAAGIVATVTALALTGCASQPADPPLLLGGPDTDITVIIPDGWHQVIDSANSQVPEMVAPTTCMGNQEIACSLGVARVATMLAATAEDAEHSVEQAILATPGVSAATSISAGPGTVGSRPGYRHRFTFNNPTSKFTCEIATVASGSPTPDAQGRREFSVVLVWVSHHPRAPKVSAIDEIVGSTQINGSEA
jgi:hypothetical protein